MTPDAIAPPERARAKLPHELFLANLIGNHILMAIAAGGLAGSLPAVLAVVPLISCAVLGFTLWRARQARTRDPWFVCCHWQLAAQRSRWFIAMLILVLAVAGAGWAAHHYAGVRKEAAFALVIGAGILPIMATVLLLIMVTSDSLHQAGQGRLPTRFAARCSPAAQSICREKISSLSLRETDTHGK